MKQKKKKKNKSTYINPPFHTVKRAEWVDESLGLLPYHLQSVEKAAPSTKITRKFFRRERKNT
jgi:hypothetical protein